MTPDPRDQPGPSFGDRIGLYTTNHRARTAILFGIFAGIVLGVAMYWVLH